MAGADGVEDFGCEARSVVYQVFSFFLPSFLSFNSSGFDSFCSGRHGWNSNSVVVRNVVSLGAEATSNLLQLAIDRVGKDRHQRSSATPCKSLDSLLPARARTESQTIS